MGGFALLTCNAVLAFVCKEAQLADPLLLSRVLTVSFIAATCFLLVKHFIKVMVPLFLKANMCGRDINKRGTPAGERPIPEPLGLIPAAVYILVLCALHLVGDHNGDARLYTAAMACVTFMTLLGFADDVLDLKWRYKLILPFIASMPLLVNYTGVTTVVMPPASGRLVDLGLGYYLYMSLLSIFCTNAINIYAGINGLEVGQSVVIGIFVLMHNALNINPTVPKDNIKLLRAHHAFSMDMMIPFVAVTLGLLVHNWYPSRVFVGDTFCYFAGMAFAMAAILGQYALTLLLFFLPQIFNFLYSVPQQLFRIVPCPRYRLPTFNQETGKLEAVKSHLNLVNLVLWITGPMTERALCVVTSFRSCVLLWWVSSSWICSNFNKQMTTLNIIMQLSQWYCVKVMQACCYNTGV
ncbi:unnamed protein product [Chondrus crispus]|uniref:UDP-N-acetylglucosamine--dolichyl-phosphate N-acetylglucosaminephosphotransferase n=1 Tax=Chondrus crispus TaxID=2769 RepID=R7QL43_CHOCR|nr:unnamed protein product [Chondrus crispus]CDF38799.1 unnamed protein product [Chondrus crispus]|eukprot:XP_005718704.1 unnamed protein product [Chondrus crispus]